MQSVDANSFRRPSRHRYNRSVRYWLIQWLVGGVALLIAAEILPGIQVDGIGAALIAALVIGLVGATVGLILKIVLLPFIILTVGTVHFLICGRAGVWLWPLPPRYTLRSEVRGAEYFRRIVAEQIQPASWSLLGTWS